MKKSTMQLGRLVAAITLLFVMSGCLAVLDGLGSGGWSIP